MIKGISSFETAFRARLEKQIEEAILANTRSLANGEARQSKNSVIRRTTAEAYENLVGRIEAFASVIVMMQEVEDDLMGRERKR